MKYVILVLCMLWPTLGFSAYYEWAKNVGESYSDSGYDIAVDGSGNTYITGFYLGTTDFDPSDDGTYNLVPNGGYDIFLAKYDSYGNKIEERSHESDGTSELRFTYKYDSDGNMIEKSSYGSDGIFDKKRTYKYDSNGNKIEKANLDHEYIVEWMFEYYD